MADGESKKEIRKGRKRVRGECIWGPEAVGEDVEVSVHRAPSSLARELRMIFPKVAKDTTFYLILTAQRTRVTLVDWGDEAAREKDELLERFVSWGSALCEAIEKDGDEYWADTIDPSSGLPSKRGTSTIFSEPDAFELLLRWKSSDAGGCKVVLHPEWGASVYPASIITSHPTPYTLFSKIPSFVPHTDTHPKKDGGE